MSYAFLNFHISHKCLNICILLISNKVINKSSKISLNTKGKEIYWATFTGEFHFLFHSLPLSSPGLKNFQTYNNDKFNQYHDSFATNGVSHFSNFANVATRQLLESGKNTSRNTKLQKLFHGRDSTILYRRRKSFNNRVKRLDKDTPRPNVFFKVYRRPRCKFNEIT